MEELSVSYDTPRPHRVSRLALPHIAHSFEVPSGDTSRTQAIRATAEMEQELPLMRADKKRERDYQEK